MSRVEVVIQRVSFVLVGMTAVILLARHGARLHDGAWAYIRPWATVAASTALLVGALAALRGATWGVMLVAIAATSFAGAYAFNIAPSWFVGVALLGWLAVSTAARPLLRRDAGAFAAAIFLALALGTAAALVVGPGLKWLFLVCG